jgi:hypothetical protein
VSLEEAAVKMLKKKLELGILEHAPYASEWFFSRNSNGKYRFLVYL